MNLRALIKIRFKFKKFGISITHDEKFEITAQKIENAQTSFRLEYDKDKVIISNPQNINFNIQKIKINPKDGVGSLLKYIYENVYSKRKLNNYLKEEANKLLLKWINNNSIFQQIESQLNYELNKFNSTPLKLSTESPPFLVHLNSFILNSKKIHLGIKAKIDNTNLLPHKCTQHLFNKEMKVSKNIIESTINYYVSYERWINQKLIEPLLCLGYKEFNEYDEPIGENANINVIGKEIKFKYWVIPLTLPDFEYQDQTNEIILNLNFMLKVNNNSYPILRTFSEGVKAQMAVKLELIHDTEDGISVKFKELEIIKLEGEFKLKPFKYSPWIPLPLSKIQSEIERTLREEMSNGKEKFNILKNEISLSEKLILQIKNFKMLNNYYEINTDWKNNIFKLMY